MSNLDPNSLTDEELQQLMQMLQGRTAPGAFGGNFGPSLDQAGIDLAGYNPVNIPQYTASGKLDKFDLTQQQQRFNLAQDQTGQLDDLMTAILGGAGSFGPDAFTPTYDYGEPLNMTGRKFAQQSIDVGGYRGYLANQILHEGKSPEEAAQSAIDLAANTDAKTVADPKQRALIESLQKSLPAARAQSGAAQPPSGVDGAYTPTPGRTEKNALYDQNKVLADASEIFTGIAKDPAFGYQDEAGNYYAKTPEQAMIKTDVMKAFDKSGIPYMTDQYTDPGYLNKAVTAATGRSPEDQQAAEQAYLDQMTQMQGEREASTKRQVDARDAMARLQAAPPQQQQPTNPMDLYRNPNPPTVQQQPQQQQLTSPMDLYRNPNPPFGGMIMPNPIDAQGQRQLDASNAARTAASQTANQERANRPDQGGGEPTKNWNQTPGPQTTQPLFYVDKDGNVVEPNKVAGGVRSLHDTAAARGLTRRPAGAPGGPDMASLQAQYDKENQANLDYYKQRREAQANDPRLDGLRAFVRASELAKAGRNPTRDAVMQRLLGIKAMGY